MTGWIRLLFDCVGKLVADRQDRPDDRDDLLSVMARARDEGGDRLSEFELIRLVGGLLSAGQESTVSEIGNLVWTLQQDRSRWHYLVANPGRIPVAVEELLR